MRFVYNTGINIYRFGIFIASLFNAKAKKLYVGQKASFKILANNVEKDAEYIWFHAASLGEFEQGRPVIEKIKESDPTSKILLTFFSPSGYEIRKNYPLADVVCYLPLDTKSNVTRFFKLIKIKKAIFIKYEFWPNYLIQLKNKQTPFFSISSIFRENQLFFRKYGSWYRNLLKSFTHIFVQDKPSFELLSNYGLKNATIAGDTRFDRVSDLAKQAKKIEIVEAFVQNAEKVIVAGSSWPKDEELLIRYFQENPKIKLIIVPHEIHEGHISSITALLKTNYIRYTQADISTVQQYNCMIVDTIGLLSSIYQYTNIAYIGGGFGVGIHNTLEAAVWNVPVVFGPNYTKFREARELISLGGGFSISDYSELKTIFDKLFTDKNSGEIAGNYVKQNTGATNLILKRY